MTTPLAVGICLSLSLIARCGRTEVVHLTTDDFESQTKVGMWFLEFYAPWCGHCKAFAPIYEDASEEMAQINFGAIDATVETELADRFKVNRFPTIRFWDDGVEYPYTGERTAEGLAQYGERMLKPVSRPLSEDADALGLALDRYHNVFVYLSVEEEGPASFELFKRGAKRFKPNLISFHHPLAQAGQIELISDELKRELAEGKGPQLIRVSVVEAPVRMDSSEWTAESVAEFISATQHPPVSLLDTDNHRTLSETAAFVAYIAVNLEEGHANAQGHAQLIESVTELVLAHPEWREKTEVNEKKKYRFVFAVTDWRDFQSFLERNFGTADGDLPALILFDNEKDGFYVQRGPTVDARFIEEAENGDLEITYVRSWFARKGLALEKYLNSLSGWKMGVFFLLIFVGIFGLMISLDWLCTRFMGPDEGGKLD